MAKTSSIEKYKRNCKRVALYPDVRLKLKETIRNPQTTPEDKELAQRKLAKIPRSRSWCTAENPMRATGAYPRCL